MVPSLLLTATASLLLVAAQEVEAFVVSSRRSGTRTTRLHVVDEANVIANGLATALEVPSSVNQILQQVPSLETIQQTVQELPTAAKVAAAAVPLIPVATTLAAYAKTQKTIAALGDERTYPEATAATYELSQVALPFEFGDAALVRPLLKQTQLEYRRLRVAYDANKHGYNAFAFHSKVDGQGAAIVLAKAKGQWFGGYNPRGWASLGGSRPSRAAFLFYQKPFFSWQKLRIMGGGGMSCGNDLFDNGIYLGAEALVVPLNDGGNPRQVRSRLGNFFEAGPDNRATLLPVAAADTTLQELKVLVGVYDEGEDIPNSGGVLDLGLY